MLKISLSKKRWEEVGPPFKKPGWYAAVVVYIDEEADCLALLFVDACNSNDASALDVDATMTRIMTFSYSYVCALRGSERKACVRSQWQRRSRAFLLSWQT